MTLLSPADDYVADDEVLYRSVAGDLRLFPLDGQGERRISSMAFNDAGRRPSVDRAILCPGGPTDSQLRFSRWSGLLFLVAKDIRQLTTVHGRTGSAYHVDVEPVPLPENISHAEIFGRPPFDTDKVCDRIKQALARIASVGIPPTVLEAEESRRT